jgi:hypothetical protein
MLMVEEALTLPALPPELLAAGREKRKKKTKRLQSNRVKLTMKVKEGEGEMPEDR